MRGRGAYGSVSLPNGVIEFAKDADLIYKLKDEARLHRRVLRAGGMLRLEYQAAAAAFVGAPAAGKEGVFSRHALDQSSRFAGLSLSKEQFNKTAPRARVLHP